MDIAQYTSQSLLGPRRAALEPVQPIKRDQQEQQPATEPDGLFETVLDTVNPLQHIPGVSSVYSEVTGDTAGPLASMAGGFLFGGPMGLAAGAASSFIEMITGKSLAGHAMALLSGEDTATPDTAGKIETAATATGDPLLTPDQGISLQQYQAFATAANDTHQGFGAKATDVSWAENVWTQQALKQATTTYDNNQGLGGSEADRTQRII